MPNDPVMLLSYVNTQLRDFYPTLESFCEDKGADPAEISRTLGQIDCAYDEALNRFQ